MDTIDTGEGLELIGDADGYVTRFEGDRHGGSSLLFAYHEGCVCYGRHAQEVTLTEKQHQQIESWFEEHDAPA